MDVAGVADRTAGLAAGPYAGIHETADGVRYDALLCATGVAWGALDCTSSISSATGSGSGRNSSLAANTPQTRSRSEDTPAIHDRRSAAAGSTGGGPTGSCLTRS